MKTVFIVVLSFSSLLTLISLESRSTFRCEKIKEMFQAAFLFSLIIHCTGYRMMTPISNFIIDSQRKEGVRYDDQNELRFHLHEVVKEAFSDAIHQNLEGIDYYSQGIAESEQKIVLLGDRITGDNVSNFCGSLARKQFFHVPIHFRDGIHFNPIKQIPIPVVNLTIHIPDRWFRDPGSRSPLMYVCYEGETFLKIHPIETKPMDWGENARFRTTSIVNSYNERSRIREILVVLDDFWNNRYLLPRNLDARAILDTKSILPRITFGKECDPSLGIEQPCCLWKFQFEDIDGVPQAFHRCFGSIPSEALKSNQIPEALADLLLRGKMTRRFLSPPTRVCREVSFKPMIVKRPDGKYMKMERLDAVKCAAFY